MLTPKYCLCLFLCGIPWFPDLFDVALESASMPRSASYKGIFCNPGRLNRGVWRWISAIFWPSNPSFIFVSLMARRGFAMDLRLICPIRR
jgi:hypothetical protein